MTASVQWSKTALDTFLRIQTIIDISSWGVFMSSMLKNDTSLERDSGLSKEEMIENNLVLIREENPSVSLVILNGHVETNKVLSFRDFEEATKPFEPEQVSWWPVNFETKKDFEVWLETQIKKELV